MKDFSERLREVLKDNQMSQSELAKKIGMSQDAVNSYCTGKRKQPIGVLILICKAVGESADYLLGLID